MNAIAVALPAAVSLAQTRTGDSTKAKLLTNGKG